LRSWWTSLPKRLALKVFFSIYHLSFEFLMMNERNLDLSWRPGKSIQLTVANEGTQVQEWLELDASNLISLYFNLSLTVCILTYVLQQNKSQHKFVVWFKLLIRHAPLYLFQNGCLCCSAQDQGVLAIESLMQRRGTFEYKMDFLKIEGQISGLTRGSATVTFPVTSSSKLQVDLNLFIANNIKCQW
jgi:hypothetical protein